MTAMGETIHLAPKGSSYAVCQLLSKNLRQKNHSLTSSEDLALLLLIK